MDNREQAVARALAAVKDREDIAIGTDEWFVAEFIAMHDALTEHDKAQREDDGN